MNILAETETKAKHNLEENPSMEAKAKTDTTTVSEIMKRSVTDTENNTEHKDKSSIATKQEGRMLVTDAGLDRNISKVSIWSNLTLSKAAEKGDLETVKMLLEQGAEIDATDSEDRTALQEALMWGHTAVAAYLLDHGADVHITDIFGMTSIQIAVESGSTWIAQLLIDKGADLRRLING